MPLSRRRTLAVLALAPHLGLIGRPASAQASEWPDKPLKIIVPATAGSSIDGLARIYADHLKTALGKPVVVDNRPGANQTIGIAAMKAAPADGHTLLLTSTELVRVPLLYPNLRYDAFSEFVPLSQIAATSTYLCAPSSLGANNLAEFIEQAKRAPAPLSVGSPGHGSGAHFYGELLAQAAGVQLNHVAYRGEVPLVPDLLGGRIAAGWLSGNLVNQYVKEGKIKVLGAGSVKHRVPSMPSVPTFTELGIPGLDIEGFIGLFALAGTPAARADRLAQEFNRIRARPEVRAQIETYGFNVGEAASRDQFEAIMRSSHEGWVQAIRKAGIKMDA